MTTVPTGLGIGGRRLWKAITDKHELDAAQEVQLLEACRAKDRLDKLDALLRGEADAWVALVGNVDGTVEVKVDGALVAANNTANLMKQLLAAIRLPDEVTGKRPQFRGARGAQKPSTPGGKVSSLAAARAAKGS